MAPIYTLYEGRVTRGFQLASGLAVGRADAPSPFPDSTLRMQHPHFLVRDFDMTREVRGIVWATINVRLHNGLKLDLSKPDRTLKGVEWAGAGANETVGAETFSFVRCVLAHDGRYYPGLIYYPHPETKPPTNAHDFGVLEVLTSRVEGLAYDDAVSVLCRADAFSIKGLKT